MLKFIFYRRNAKNIVYLHRSQTNMRKLLPLLLFAVVSVHAQKSGRMSNREMAGVDTKAPIGLDLMGGNKSGVTVYPNADNDHILVSVSGKQSVSKSIAIYDFSGRMVFQTGKSNENTYLVDVSGLKKDTYVVEVASGGKIYRKKWLRS